MQIFELKVQLI